MSPGMRGCLLSISAPCGCPQWARCRGAAPWPLSPSGCGAAVFVLLAAPVISAQHTQEVLSGIVHPRPDLYRKKSIKSRPSTSAATSCLCAAGGRPCRGREAGTQARQTRDGQAGMAAGSRRGARRWGCSWRGGGRLGTTGTIRAAAVAAAGMRWTGRDGMGSWHWGQRECVLARPDPAGSGWVFAPAQAETMAGASGAGWTHSAGKGLPEQMSF